MAFSNPILGNEVLVRTAMQSEGFQIGSEGQVNGWRFERDGSAFLTDVTVGNTNYIIDQQGNASFNDVNVAGELTYQGNTLPEILELFPKGVTTWGALNTVASNTVNSSTEGAMIELDCILEDMRMYRLVMAESTFTVTLGTGGTFPWVGTLRFRDGGSGSPTTSSNLLQRASIELGAFTGAAGHSKGFEFMFSCNSAFPADAQNLLPGLHRFAMTMAISNGTVGTGGSLAITTGSGTNNPITLYLEDMGPLVENTGQALAGGGGGTNPVQTYVKTYSANWSRSWDGSLGVRFTNGEISQGQYSGSEGNQRSWIGFPFSTIQSDLVGATISKVEFYLYYDHWYSFSGGTAVIGTHSSTATSAPTYNGAQDNQDRKRVSWQINQGKWVDMTSIVGNEFKTGTSTGIAIGIGPTTSNAYYGKARGNTQTHEPQIRITYKK